MAEDDKDIDSFPRGNDWEVVSLTTSVYAASPGPIGFDAPGQFTGTEFNRVESETSDAMFMSGHFVFPPNEHENLPIEPNSTEICNEPRDQDLNLAEEKGNGGNRNCDENWKCKSDDDLQRIEFFEKGKSVSPHDVEFTESKALHSMTSVGKEQVMFRAPEFGAFDAEVDVNQLALCDGITDIPGAEESSEEHQLSPKDYTNTSKSEEESESGGPGVPCEAWWKGRGNSLYDHVKEANKFWSIFVVAAVLGLVVFGHRWRKEKLQLQHLKLQSSFNSERMKEMAGPISRFKSVLAGDPQLSSLIPGIPGGSASTYLGV